MRNGDACRRLRGGRGRETRGLTDVRERDSGKDTTTTKSSNRGCRSRTIQEAR